MLYYYTWNCEQIYLMQCVREMEHSAILMDNPTILTKIPILAWRLIFAMSIYYWGELI